MCVTVSIITLYITVSIITLYITVPCVKTSKYK